MTIRDNGIFNGRLDPDALNLIVLRGPCTIGLRTLHPFANKFDGLVLIPEPWRTISREEAEAALKTPVDVEIPFSERISRLADAGLLGARLSRLDEFLSLRQWADALVRTKKLQLPTLLA